MYVLCVKKEGFTNFSLVTHSNLELKKVKKEIICTQNILRVPPPHVARHRKSNRNPWITRGVGIFERFMREKNVAFWNKLKMGVVGDHPNSGDVTKT